MISELRELYGLLERPQRFRLLRLQLLIIIMAFAEIGSVVSVGYFMSLAGDLGRLDGEGWLAQAYRISGVASPDTFLTLLGVGVLLAITLAGLCSAYTTWRLSLYSAQIGAELSSRLYRYFLYQPWLFHVGHSSSRLIHKTSQEVQRLTQRIITPCMQLNARLVMVTLMMVALFLYDPQVALVGSLVFACIYLLLYRTVRRVLVANGKSVTRHQTQRYHLLTEGFGGIKELLLWHLQGGYAQRFESASRKVARGQGVTQGLSEAPRYIVELVAFGSVIMLVLYLLNRYDGNTADILPALSVYALAGFKLLPAFQRIYACAARIRGNLAAFETIRPDLRASLGSYTALSSTDSAQGVDEPPMVVRESIEVRNIAFHYPGKQEAALHEVNLSIPSNQMVGLVGASGSGKSTLIDLLLGLVPPTRGEVRVDGVPLTETNMSRWQAGVGFVPQQIFLADASILENVAFGIQSSRIDETRVREALSMAQLDEMIQSLPEGIATRVGERGVQLSGGQRQRIGIARALYRQAKVMVFDEATSALDGITESRVMVDIQRFAGRMTIVLVAHRLTTVRDCDIIYMLDGGRVVDGGSFDELASRNATFKMMANL